jgi:serine/threonine protein phosphatase 1
MATGTETAGGRQGWFNRFLSKKRSLPKVPQGTRVYAVGDIHGRMDLLEKLLVQIKTHAGQEKRQNSLVFLGDYVDRGPQSKDVVDYLMRMQWPGWDIVYLRGNHDQAVLDFLEDASFYRAWREFGAAETLLSYGVTPPRFDAEGAFAKAHDDFLRKCPESHVEFLRSLPFFHIVGDYMFVHAGVRPGIALDRQSPEDMMWIREEFLFSDLRLDKVIVHGHSPSERPVLRANRIGVDTGAYATDCLTAVVLEGEECTFLSTSGTQPAS